MRHGTTFTVSEMGTIGQTPMDVFMTETSSNFKQLNSKIDVLTRSVSQLKETVLFLCNNKTISTSSSNCRRVDLTTDKHGVCNGLVENETLNEEAGIIRGVENTKTSEDDDENQNDVRQRLQDVQSDDEEELLNDDGDGCNQNVRSNDSSNNDQRKILTVSIDESDRISLNDDNDSMDHDETLGLQQQQNGLQNDDREKDTPAPIKVNGNSPGHINVSRVTATKVPDSDSETDFEAPPLKTKASTPKVIGSNSEEKKPQSKRSSTTRHSLFESDEDMFDDSKSKSTESLVSSKNKKDMTQNKGRKLLDEFSSEDSSSDESDDFYNDFKENRRKKSINSRTMANNGATILGKRRKLTELNLDSGDEDRISKRMSDTKKKTKSSSGVDNGAAASHDNKKRHVLELSDLDDSDSMNSFTKFYLGKKENSIISNAKKNKIYDSDSEDDSHVERCQSLDAIFTKDPKLHGQACFVLMERLPEVILDRLYTQKFIEIISDDDRRNQGKKGRDMDPLLRAIKQLCNFEAMVSDSPNKRNYKSSKSPKKDARKKMEKASGRFNESSSDESTKVVRKTPLPSLPVDDLGEDRVGSDDDELDAPAADSDSDSSAAKRRVLKHTGAKLPKLEPSESSKSKARKPSGGNYYTPTSVRLPNSSDSDDASEEHSDDDDFVSVKKVKHKHKVKKYVVDSDSDTRSQLTDKSKHKSGKAIDGSSSKKHNSKSRKLSSSSDSDFKTKKRKRRKIQSDDGVKGTKLKTEVPSIIIEDESDSDIQVVTDEEVPASQGKGRINIRPIISKKELQKETRTAQEEEQKRKERLAERQRLFNSFLPLALEITDAVVENLVLDVDKTTKEPLISVDPVIVRKLKPHQAKGIKFLWDSCFESLEQYKRQDNEGSGCILAHCMGLGKTLQTVGFLHCVMTSDLLEMKSTLVICPLNTVTNWAKELKLWLGDVSVKVPVHKLHEGKNIQDRVEALETWQRRGGIGIMHYERFRELVGDPGKQIKSKKAKEKEVYQPRITKCLLEPGPDIVVCDEAHMIKNNKSKVSLTMNQIRTKRRILLTGTPLQNNLVEYHTMMQFVKPNLLGSLKEFRNRFVNPITNGQHRDSDDRDVRIMKRRAHVLHKLLDGCVQRLDYSVLVPYLPPKHEYVLLIKLTDVQKNLYKYFVDSIMQGGDESIAKRIKQRKFLADFAALSKVWSHPYSLTLRHNENNDNVSEIAGSLKDFIDDGLDITLASPMSVLIEQDNDIDWLNNDLDIVSKATSKPEVTEEIGDTGTTAPIVDQLPAINEMQQPMTTSEVIEERGDWWSQFFQSKDDISALEHSSKFIILFEILKTCESIGDKVLVFSQSLKSLNMIEQFLEDLDKEARTKSKNNQATFPPAKSGDNFRWRKNKEYYRIDGSTKTEDRQRSCDNFNKSGFNQAKLFLISTKAGGLGINLVGANRVVIFDASWNPSQDLQSIFRVFRFGQTKPCYVYRLVAQGTMEEKVYNRQVVKLSLSGRVIDEHQIGRHFTFDDILKMYECDFEEKPDRPTPAVPKDRLLADLLMSHKNILDNFLEHDSLLVNQMDEGLTDEERLAAWNDYQSEKDTAPRSMAEPFKKINAKIRELYPNVAEDELQRYFRKVQTDFMELERIKEMRRNGGELSETEKAEIERQWEVKTARLPKCLTDPTYLGSVMASQGEQRSNPGLSTDSNIPQGNGIRLAPMSNILEPSFLQSMADMRIPNAQTYFNPTTPNIHRGHLPTTTMPYDNN